MISQRIAETRIEGVAVVSTVLLPPNMSYGNPYETMIFNGEETATYDTRSATLDEALLAHIDAITIVMKEITDGL